MPIVILPPGWNADGEPIKPPVLERAVCFGWIHSSDALSADAKAKLRRIDVRGKIVRIYVQASKQRFFLAWRRALAVKDYLRSHGARDVRYYTSFDSDGKVYTYVTTQEV